MSQQKSSKKSLPKSRVFEMFTMTVESISEMIIVLRYALLK